MDHLLSVFIVMLGIITVISTLLSILLYSRNPKLLHSLSYNQLHTRKIQYPKQQTSKLIMYDYVAISLGWIAALITTIILLPVLILFTLLLLIAQTKPIITYHTIIGKKQKPIHLYFFNIASVKSATPSPLIRLLIMLDKGSISKLPQLFNILHGDITLFGLTQINYDEMSSISLHNDSLLQQYNKHRPGLVSLSVLNKEVLHECKTAEEKYEIISFLNSVFLQRRSLFMLLNVLKTIVLWAFRPIP